MKRCRICGVDDDPSSGIGAVSSATLLCDRCWELESRIHNDPALARKILTALMSERIGHGDRCKACNVPIQWATTEKGGTVPLDLRAVVYHAMPVPGNPSVAPNAVRTRSCHVTHFATCPDAKLFSKGGRG